MLTKEQVIWAYRCFFGRDPEDEKVIEHHRRHANWDALRKAFVRSAEFTLAKPTEAETSIGRHTLAPANQVDLDIDPDRLAAMFRHVSDSWVKLGEEEPHWSVVTQEAFRSSEIEKTEADFYRSGEGDRLLVEAFFQRNGESLGGIRNCLEFGCGVGRATAALSRILPHIDAVDISEPHLRLARQWFDRSGITNVDLVHLRSVADVATLPNFDLLYSTIVFQHNPPPVIRYLLDVLFSKLNTGGYVLFQVPTYRANYSFHADQYLQNATPGMEMHVLPQRALFSLFRRHGIEVIEVQEDWLTGSALFLSNTFFGRKA